MAEHHTTRIVRHLQTADDAARTDAQLLGGFVERRDEGAFAALVARHAPMVWGVCRRALDRHDAEDAFQATFLVLVRKAAAVVPRDRVGRWLYGVARTTALQARRAARRRAREALPADVPDPHAGPPDPWQELLPLLDEAVALLPERYRAVVVLCDLGGTTRAEAARQLGVPEGTVAGRLARARALLAKRLGRRGGLLSGALAGLLAQRAAPAGVPAGIVADAIRVATQVAAGRAAGLVSPPAAALTEGVLRAMLLTKVKNAVLALVVTAAAATAAGGVVFQDTAAPPAPGAPVVVPPPAAKADLPTPPPPVGPVPPSERNFDLKIPAPPTVEQLRARYVKLHEELAAHLSEDQVVQRVAALEQEVAERKAQLAQMAREKKAADELEAARATLAKIANDYTGTTAATRAKQALESSARPPNLFEVAPPSPPKIDTSPSLRPPGGAVPRKE
ncbi:MAG TPA: sigma-70 family RNA polymerase sigma factor [Urbifossiella sp.]|nr:sigma-70 family RNA polymerase sigma factor [Urbifossiella sp.]